MEAIFAEDDLLAKLKETLHQHGLDKPLPQAQYLEEFEAVLRRMLMTTTAKNSDYASNSDAFSNFRLIEFLSHGKITKEMGVLVRLSDKWSRIVNLMTRDGDPHVKDESCDDTLIDNAVYSIILYIMRRHRGR